jgi:hypothetical protein
MKTLAQLKRDLVVGARVKTIVQTIKPEKEGMIRDIKKKQTNAICFNDSTTRNGESWLWFDLPANYYEYDNNTFKVYSPLKINRSFENGKEKKEYIGKELTFIYEIID